MGSPIVWRTVFN
jgi:hypothetical protein